MSRKRTFVTGVVVGAGIAAFMWKLRRILPSPSYPQSWYNAFAHVYDYIGTTWFYRPMRQETIRQLRLAPGHTVVDVACGTGQNFQYVVDRIGPEGLLIGVDYSTGMLDRAAQRIQRHGWRNVYLVHADATLLSLDVLNAVLPRPVSQVDRIFSTLGLSVIPQWERAFEAMWNVLVPGGRCALMDGYVPEPGFRRWFVNTVAAADVSRRFWEPLQERCADYEERVFSVWWGRIVVASGTKPQ